MAELSEHKGENRRGIPFNFEPPYGEMLFAIHTAICFKKSLKIIALIAFPLAARETPCLSTPCVNTEKGYYFLDIGGRAPYTSAKKYLITYAIIFIAVVHNLRKKDRA